MARGRRWIFEAGFIYEVDVIDGLDSDLLYFSGKSRIFSS